MRLNLSPSMKILSINDFTTKLLTKLLSDLYIGVHLKGTKKFGSKVIDAQYMTNLTLVSPSKWNMGEILAFLA